MARGGVGTGAALMGSLPLPAAVATEMLRKNSLNTQGLNPRFALPDLQVGQV